MLTKIPVFGLENLETYIFYFRLTKVLTKIF